MTAAAMSRTNPVTAGIADLSGFDSIIDARSPAEFSEDHIPGALSCPVLDNEQRRVVGTLHKESPFAARRVGGALVARNIGQHIETHFHAMPANWRPLVYCWRGGMRSGAFAHVLRQIGWKAAQLEGGYKAYRRHVIETLTDLPTRHAFRVVAGPTGSGKSRLLAALAHCGAQVLDLEALACHRGSVLGSIPGAPQPSQKLFETLIFERLASFPPDLPVYVEAESKRIGLLRVPDALVTAMRASPCLSLDAPIEARVAFLLEDYDWFLTGVTDLKQSLARLSQIHGNEVIENWCALADAGAWPSLVRELLERHYDPSYQRSQTRNYHAFSTAQSLRVADLTGPTLLALAESLVRA